MFSYVYMKILESQPERYDRGISWLSLGKIDQIKKKIVEEEVKPGEKILEIGVGTGILAIMCARKGAKVLGIDISPAMLEVARKKVREEGLKEAIELKEMSISEMDKLEGEFDLVIATLVFSELYSQEQDYALTQAYRLLRAEGKLIIGDETRPQNFFKYLIYFLVRLPLWLITFLLTQTTTRAVVGIEERIKKAGFRIIKLERSFLDSFIYLVAVKERR